MIREIKIEFEPVAKKGQIPTLIALSANKVDQNGKSVFLYHCSVVNDEDSVLISKVQIVADKISGKHDLTEKSEQLQRYVSETLSRYPNMG